MSGCTICDGGECCDMRERARVVGVLDAWASERDRYIEQGTYGFDIKLHYRGGPRGGFTYARFEGVDFDEARAKAAEAIEAGEV